MSLDEVIRAAATDEALLSEASKYGDISLLAKGRGFFSPSSFLRRTLVKGGSFGLGRGEDVVSEGNLVSLRVQMSLRLLMVECDSQDRMMGVRRGKMLSFMKVGDRCESPKVEGSSQEERGIRGGWEDSSLAKFSRLLAFPTKGFEEEILIPLQRIKSRREKGKKKICLVTTNFDHELKKLEYSINYNRGKKRNGLDRRGGAKEVYLT